jgi:hypothetical protein
VNKSKENFSHILQFKTVFTKAIAGYYFIKKYGTFNSPSWQTIFSTTFKIKKKLLVQSILTIAQLTILTSSKKTKNLVR